MLAEIESGEMKYYRVADRTNCLPLGRTDVLHGQSFSYTSGWFSVQVHGSECSCPLFCAEEEKICCPLEKHGVNEAVTKERTQWNVECFCWWITVVQLSISVVCSVLSNSGVVNSLAGQWEWVWSCHITGSAELCKEAFPPCLLHLEHY